MTPPVATPRTIDVGAGTEESRWERSEELRALPAFRLDPIERLVVVAPHPDDEILAIGATLGRLSAAGAEIVLVAVTDGEASHPGSDAVTAEELAALRPEESHEACRRLGIVLDHERRLSIPDGAVRAHQDRLRSAIEAELDERTWCFAPFLDDGHPDHEASAHAAAEAAEARGAPFVEFPIWAWHWSVPGDGAIPFARAHAVELSGEDLDAKSQAIAAFRSQVRPLGGDPADGPVLPPRVLAHFVRRFEIVLVP